MRKLVVVDDCIVVRTIVKWMIPAKDWELICYSEPKQLLADMEKGNWDALITDYDMPGLNGYELTRLAREKNIKVVMMTANRQVPKLHPDIHSVTEKLLFKPFKRSSLIEAIKAL